MENRIREMRQQRGLSQESLAQILGVSRQTVISLETNRYKPSLILAHKIAQLFEKSIEEMFIFAEDENLLFR